jgi:hypothetical protein
MKNSRFTTERIIEFIKQAAVSDRLVHREPAGPWICDVWTFPGTRSGRADDVWQMFVDGTYPPLRIRDGCYYT